MTQRKHQREFENIISGIISGSGVKKINLIATPGAGKSSIPMQACRLIKAGLADAIMWAVPRSSLQNQGERNFLDPFFQEMFGHNYSIRESTNEHNPCRGTDGFVTTYQAIAADKEKTVLKEVVSKRYIIVLDEFHHLEQYGTWHEHIKDIVSAGHFLILMTGTLGRGDKKQIAYVDYNGLVPDLKSSGDTRTIIYTRTDALRERAIIPIEFHLNDGTFKWKRQNGKTAGVNSFKNAKTPTQMAEALFTALNSDFASEMAMECLTHWTAYRQQKYNAKLLIVTANYESAKNVYSLLNGMAGLSIEIATSHKTPEAVKNINKFKSGECNCLVTIAMAYEGLDVPEISHICVLTNIRSREWIEQMLARGVRVDRAASYDNQRCYVFAPMDRRLKTVVDMIKKQQMSAIEFLAEVRDQKEDLSKDGMEQLDLFMPKNSGLVTPILSKMTDHDLFFMGIEPHEKQETRLKRPEIVMTVKEQERALRKTIHKYINKYCFENKYKPGIINGELKAAYNKGREQMTLSELKDLYEYIREKYKVGKPRGSGRRVSQKVESWECDVELSKSFYM